MPKPLSFLKNLLQMYIKGSDTDRADQLLEAYPSLKEALSTDLNTLAETLKKAKDSDTIRHLLLHANFKNRTNADGPLATELLKHFKGLQLKCLKTELSRLEISYITLQDDLKPLDFANTFIDIAPPSDPQSDTHHQALLNSFQHHLRNVRQEELISFFHSYPSATQEIRNNDDFLIKILFTRKDFNKVSLKFILNHANLKDKVLRDPEFARHFIDKFPKKRGLRKSKNIIEEWLFAREEECSSSRLTSTKPLAQALSENHSIAERSELFSSTVDFTPSEEVIVKKAILQVIQSNKRHSSPAALSSILDETSFTPNPSLDFLLPDESHSNIADPALILEEGFYTPAFSMALHSSLEENFLLSPNRLSEEELEQPFERHVSAIKMP